METIHHTHSDHHHHPPNSQRSAWFQKMFNPLRGLIDGIEVRNYRLAHIICQVIPCCCPFERNVNLFGQTFHIPALCKLNPVYDELVGMRFRALSFLADECGEDVTKYIC